MSIADLISQAISQNKQVAVLVRCGNSAESNIVLKPLRWVSDIRFEAMSLREKTTEHYCINDINKIEILEDSHYQLEIGMIEVDQAQHQDGQEAELIRLDEKLSALEGLFAEKELSYRTLQGELASFHVR